MIFLIGGQEFRDVRPMLAAIFNNLNGPLHRENSRRVPQSCCLTAQWGKGQLSAAIERLPGLLRQTAWMESLIPDHVPS